MQLIRQGPLLIRDRWLPGLALGLMALPATAQSFTPFARFDDMTLQELETVQVKLTYVGPQSKALPSAVGTETSNTPNIAAFTPFRRPGLSYSNDDVPPQTFLATAAELRQAIDNVGTLPAVASGGVQVPSFLSFALHSTLDGGIAFESVLNPASTVSLFAQLRGALTANRPALIVVNVMGCALDATPPGMASDVTASVSTRLSGVRLDRVTGRFLGTLTIENTGVSPISGPISVAVVLPPTVSLANVDGFTCKHAPAGRRYVDMPVAGSLAVGQSLEAVVELDNPDREQLAATFQVLAGTGAR